MTQRKGFGLSSTALRYIAMLFMLLDHAWATVVSGNNWMTYLGRLAMPIFAFLIAEGYVHTSNIQRYKKRLVVFGLIAEIPFNLMVSGSVFFLFHQNVMFTLLYGLWAIEAIERICQNRATGNVVKNVLLLLGIAILSVITFVDYNIMGVATVVLFHMARKLPFTKIWQVVGMVFLNIVWHKGLVIPIAIGNFVFEFTTQGFAIFSLLLIWLYNGKKGSNSRVVQYFAYAFYPLHMLVLYLIWLMM